MKIRLRHRQLVYAGGIGALGMLLLAMGGTYWGYNVLAKSQAEKIAVYEDKLRDAQKLLDQQNAAKTKIWVLKDDIKAGDEIKGDALIPMDVLKGTVPENTVSKDYAVGKKTKLALKKDTPLVEPMLYQDGVTPNDLRFQEFKLITLPSNLVKDDFVDVRVKFPTGQDYILLAKKKVKDLAAGTVWYEMNETEILSMSSGIVDAYINDAAIYALKYADPYMQEKAIVNYPPNEKVIDLMNSDPNIVKKATAELERRKRQNFEKDLNGMDEAAKQKYRNGMQSSNAAAQNNAAPASTADQAQKPAVSGANPASPTNQGLQPTQSQPPQPQLRETMPAQQPVISAPSSGKPEDNNADGQDPMNQ